LIENQQHLTIPKVLNEEVLLNARKKKIKIKPELNLWLLFGARNYCKSVFLQNGFESPH
jgi:hypothetical protein